MLEKKCKKLVIARCIIYILIGIIAFGTLYIHSKEGMIKSNYVSYYVRGYGRAMRDWIEKERYLKEHPYSSVTSLYFYIVGKALKDIRREVYEGIEAPERIELK